MGMLIKKDWEEDRGKMTFPKLAGAAFGTISCGMALTVALLLGLYFWNVVGSTAAAVICGIVVIAWAVAVGMAAARIVAKTNGKFGKCRPFMVIGNVLMLIGGAVLVCFTHKLPDSIVGRSIFFVVFALVFAAGLAVQLVSFGIGRGCMPTEKKSRLISAVCNVVLAAAFVVLSVFLAQTLKQINGGYGEVGFCIAAWNYLSWTGLVSMVIFVASIAGRDANQYYQ